MSCSPLVLQHCSDKLPLLRQDKSSSAPGFSCHTLYYVSGQYGGWRENYLIPCVYQTPEAFNTGASTYVGKSMTVMMPIMIENVQNDYTFKFNIDKLSNTATK
ncbi:hypothetical protein [Prevotella histicola]|uniref:hypothetical protein n=1 Tax=Prevotella histicola TaxID=470565 RepID=UPI00241E93C0|nr:hypothetical protein [Prevotella histicola]